MNNTELNALLNLIQSSPDSANLTASVLQLVADSAALKAVKNKVQPADLTDKKFIKFTKQEIEDMPESIKQFITIMVKYCPARNYGECTKSDITVMASISTLLPKAKKN